MVVHVCLVKLMTFIHYSKFCEFFDSLNNLVIENNTISHDDDIKWKINW